MTGQDTAVPVLRATGLVKTHRAARGGAEVKAVRGVDLTVGRGDFVAVTGPSGAGKSTLLHLLAGLRRPDAGEIHLDGLARRHPPRGRLGRAAPPPDRHRLPDRQPGLRPHRRRQRRTARPARRHSARTARERREELLADLGLADRADAAPGDLSGGERQRAALARALVNDPDLLFADEPTGSLDSRSAREVLALLTRHHAKGRTIVLVTHDARVAGSADRVVSLFDGLITDDTRIDDTPPARGVGDVLDLGG
ncbi:ABC transporter ATP-binding protein [Kitasatospora arboriphila]